MSWLSAPIADRVVFGKMLRAIDIALGFPRTHPESQLVRYGRAPHAATVRTETQCQVMVNTTLGAIALSIDATIATLSGRSIMVDGENILITMSNLGWVVSATLPGNAANWAVAAYRDGGAGSPNGVPIP
jgi:hypothetical protein